ncbi:MAG: HAD family phosphatase [Planctomycetota bacterium]|jgi:HAD superfamily hydrolase (TIGR01509 family)|nr:HAD family phosphatase [Planctomycetota bacterium]
MLPSFPGEQASCRPAAERVFAIASEIRYTDAFVCIVPILESDMPTLLKLAAFDLDGVIADTEPLHKNAKLRIFRELDLKNSMDLDQHIGRPNSELWMSVIRENSLDRTPKELEKTQYDYILEQMRDDHIPLSDGLVDLVDAFERAGARCGVCSSSDRYYVDRVLALYGLTGRFGFVVAGDQVPEKKPAPDGYRKLAADAGVDPAFAVAIEDSSAGVASATAAGLRCIGYVNPTSGKQDLRGSFMRVHKLAEITSWLDRNT